MVGEADGVAVGVSSMQTERSEKHLVKGATASDVCNLQRNMIDHARTDRAHWRWAIGGVPRDSVRSDSVSSRSQGGICFGIHRGSQARATQIVAKSVVERRGFEPLTSAVRGQRSPS